jgi:hypothetical protein
MKSSADAENNRVLPDTGYENGETTAGLGNVVNQLHDEHSLADTGNTEQTNLKFRAYGARRSTNLDTGSTPGLGGPFYELGSHVEWGGSDRRWGPRPSTHPTTTFMIRAEGTHPREMGAPCRGRLPDQTLRTPPWRWCARRCHLKAHRVGRVICGTLGK